MTSHSGFPRPGSPADGARLICPRCRVGEVTYGSRVCRLCGYAVATVADDLVPPAFEENVRQQLSQQFRLERPLGRGGMSVVYLAREVELNRYVALEVLPQQLVLGPEAADRFKREAKIGASLDHPHIVPVLRIGSTQAFLWYSDLRFLVPGLAGGLLIALPALVGDVSAEGARLTLGFAVAASGVGASLRGSTRDASRAWQEETTATRSANARLREQRAAIVRAGSARRVEGDGR